MIETQEWLTVAEAARRLGLSDRHARRLVDRLNEADRLKQGTSPTRVRLAALAQVWEGESAGTDSRTHPHRESDPESDSQAVTEKAVSRARLEERLEAAEALILELRQDKRQLQDSLTREQENHLRLLEQLAEERQELRLLQARVIQALPPPRETEHEADVPPLTPATPEPEIPAAVDAMDSDQGDVAPPSVFVSRAAPTSPAPRQEPPRLGFWRRLTQWISD